MPQDLLGHRAEPRCYNAGNDRCPSEVEGAVLGTEYWRRLFAAFCYQQLRHNDPHLTCSPPTFGEWLGVRPVRKGEGVVITNYR